MKMRRRSLALILALCVAFTFSAALPAAAKAKGKKPGQATITSIFKYTATNSQITWNKVPNAKKYEVYVSVNNKKFKKAGTTKRLFFQQRKLKNGAIYRYKVRAVNGKKKGPFSAVKYIPRTIQEYFDNNPEEYAQTQADAAANKYTLVFSSNDIIYGYDATTELQPYVDNYNCTEQELIAILGAAADAKGNVYVNKCRTIEQKSYISGVRITINYFYKGRTLVTRMYTSSGRIQ